MIRIIKLVISAIAVGLVAMAWFLPIVNNAFLPDTKIIEVYKQMYELIKISFEAGTDSNTFIFVGTIFFIGIFLGIAVLTIAFIAIKNFFGALSSKKTRAGVEASIAFMAIGLTMALDHYQRFSDRPMPEMDSKLYNIFLAGSIFTFTDTLYYIAAGTFAIIVLSAIANGFARKTA